MDSAVRYVGKTSRPKQRLACHVSDAKCGKCRYVMNWIRSLLSIGLRPVMQVGYAAFSEAEANRVETLWITTLREEGASLTNLTLGGEGMRGHVVSDGTRVKQAEAKRGKLHSTETKRRMSAAHSGERAWWYGKHLPQDVMEKMSAAHKGKPTWNKGRPGLRGVDSPRFGVQATEATRRKLALASRGKKASQATRDLLSELRTGASNPFFGKRHSEATRQRMQKPHRCSLCRELGHTLRKCSMRGV